METSFKSHKKMVRELLEITESLRMVPLSYKTATKFAIANWTFLQIFEIICIGHLDV